MKQRPKLWNWTQLNWCDNTSLWCGGGQIVTLFMHLLRIAHMIPWQLMVYTDVNRLMANVKVLPDILVQFYSWRWVIASLRWAGWLHDADERLVAADHNLCRLSSIKIAPYKFTIALPIGLHCIILMYRVGQIKWHHFTFLLVTNECMHQNLWFLARMKYIKEQIRRCYIYNVMSTLARQRALQSWLLHNML